ncbi:IclR family transcriptional regulator [Pollutimonas sp. H1-120]|uniref:IclR family transcriptional regulator n=1 Tax=Pollutimonas sp. H1-120 TaxID=3148824 RepID=UPI003B528679
MDNNTGKPLEDKPLDRFLNVMDAVASAGQPITMTDVAVICGLPVPTVHRLVAQLEERRLLKRFPGSKKLVVGLSLVQLGSAAVHSALRADQPHQILAALASAIGEHCQIGQRVDHDVVYVDAASSSRSQGLRFEPGRRSPMHCSSIGKLFLAEMSDSQFEQWLKHAKLNRETSATITSPKQLRVCIEQVRDEQWATSNEEVVTGVVGCAVPIHDQQGRLIAGLGIAAPSARVTFSQLMQFKSPMQQASIEIAQALISAA